MSYDSDQHDETYFDEQLKEEQLSDLDEDYFDEQLKEELTKTFINHGMGHLPKTLLNEIIGIVLKDRG